MAVYPLEIREKDRSNDNLKMESSEDNDAESFNGFRKVMFILRLTGNSFRGSQLSVEHPSKRYKYCLILYEVGWIIFRSVLPIIMFDDIQESYLLKTSSRKPVLRGLVMIGASTGFIVTMAIKWMTLINGPRIFELIEILRHEFKLTNDRKSWYYFRVYFLYYLIAMSLFVYEYFYYGKSDSLLSIPWWKFVCHLLSTISQSVTMLILPFVMGYFVWMMVCQIKAMKRKLQSNNVIKYWHNDLMKLKRRMEQIDGIISPVIAVTIVSDSIFLMALICMLVEMKSNLHNLSISLLSMGNCVSEIIVCCMLGERLAKEVDKFVDELEWRLSCRTEDNIRTNEIKEVKHSVELLMIHNLKSQINFSMFSEFNVRLSLLLSIGSIIISYTVIIIQTSL